MKILQLILFDQINGQYIPANYVTNINIRYNDKILINAETERKPHNQF